MRPGGEAVAVYVMKGDNSLVIKEFSEWCNCHPMLIKYERLRYWKFVDQLPYTATGKKIHYLERAGDWRHGQRTSRACLRGCQMIDP